MFGSHHISLVDACGRLWNSLLDPANRDQKHPPADLLPVPVLQPATSDESFGLVKANSDVRTYHSLVAVKEEPDDSLVNLSSQDPEEAERIVRSLGLDPSLLQKPLERDRGLSSPAPKSHMPSGRSAIAFVPGGEVAEVMSIDTESALDPTPPQPSQPSVTPVRNMSYIVLQDTDVFYSTGEPKEAAGVHYSLAHARGSWHNTWPRH